MKVKKDAKPSKKLRIDSVSSFMVYRLKVLYAKQLILQNTYI
jgi:hypothetical protein